MQLAGLLIEDSSWFFRHTFNVWTKVLSCFLIVSLEDPAGVAETQQQNSYMQENSAIRKKRESLLIPKNNQTALSPCTEAQSAPDCFLPNVASPLVAMRERLFNMQTRPRSHGISPPEFAAAASLAELIWQPRGWALLWSRQERKHTAQSAGARHTGAHARA